MGRRFLFWVIYRSHFIRSFIKITSIRLLPISEVDGGSLAVAGDGEFESEEKPLFLESGESSPLLLRPSAVFLLSIPLFLRYHQDDTVETGHCRSLAMADGVSPLDIRSSAASFTSMGNTEPDDVAKASPLAEDTRLFLGDGLDGDSPLLFVLSRVLRRRFTADTVETEHCRSLAMSDRALPLDLWATSASFSSAGNCEAGDVARAGPLVR